MPEGGISDGSSVKGASSSPCARMIRIGSLLQALELGDAESKLHCRSGRDIEWGGAGRLEHAAREKRARSGISQRRAGQRCKRAPHEGCARRESPSQMGWRAHDRARRRSKIDRDRE